MNRRLRVKSLEKHGATGQVSDLHSIEACHQGVCMKCSGKWGPLYLHIPSHYPALLAKDALRKYRDEFQIPIDVPLAADWHRKRLSEGQSKAMQGPGGEQRRKRLAEKSSGPHPNRYGKSGRKSSHKVAIFNWPIAKRLTRGDGLVATMKELGAPNHKLIQRRAESMGLAFGAPFFCDQCEPFRYRSLFALRRISGFEVTAFDKGAALSEGRSAATRPPDSIVNPDEARKAIGWRDGVLKALLSLRTLYVAGEDYRKDEVIKTFVPELAETNRVLVLTIPEVRKAAREHPEWTANELYEFICIGAAREESVKAADYRWRKTLRYLWQAEEWIAKNMDRLRGSEGGGPLVREMIGFRWGVTQQTVQNALRDRVKPIEPAEIRLLIMTYAPLSAAPKAGRRRGSKTTETKDRIPIAAALIILRYSQTAMIPLLYPEQHDREAGRKAVQKFLRRNAAAIKRARGKITPQRARNMLASRQI